MDTNGDSFDVHVSNAAISIDGYNQPGNFSIDAADLVIETTTSGDLWLNGADDIHATATNILDLNATTIDADATTVNVDATGAISLDAAAASNFTVDDAGLTLETTDGGGGGGSVTINAAGATSDVDIDAGYDVTIDAVNSVSIDAGAASNFTTTVGKVTIDGAAGIELDGNGGNVIPVSSCTDSLGDSTHGWTSIYLCMGNTVVGIGDPGGNDVHNSTSGANVVGTNSNNFDTFGPDMTDNTVQAALEAIDGYLQDLSLENLDTTYVKTVGLDINGAVLNGVVRVSTDAGTPALDYHKNQTSRASWTIPVPTDWDGISDIEVEAIWSPASNAAGNVEWRLEYKSLALTELASSAASTDDYQQAAAGTADEIQSTLDNLVIPAAAVSTGDELIVINIVRRGSAAGDTYANYAQLHLVKYSYVAQNIV
jgi:hypothetical protein